MLMFRVGSVRNCIVMLARMGLYEVHVDDVAV